MRDRANEVRIRINDGITVPQVRLIDENGEQLGIKSIRFAQDYAAEHEPRPRRGGRSGRPARLPGHELQQVPLRA